MKKPKLKIANFEWTSQPSRDRTPSTLIANYLRLLDVEVREFSIFDALHVVHTWQPDLVFMQCTTGARENVEVAEYIRDRGIPLIAFSPEGNYKGEDAKVLRDMIFGWSKKEILLENYRLLWSEKARTLVAKKYPELAERLKVAGVVGADIYPLMSLKNRKQSAKAYALTVGIGCWDFGVAHPEDHRYPSALGFHGPAGIEKFQKDRILFREALKQLINNNRNVRFILRHHPGRMLGDFSSAVEGLTDLANVEVSKHNLVHDLSESDVWLVYDSTTTIEAWLMKKPTIVLNPSGPDFRRDAHWKGSMLCKSSRDVQEKLDQLMKKEELVDFELLSEKRAEYLDEAFGHVDGLSHVRAGNFIMDRLSEYGHLAALREESAFWRRVRKRQHALWLSSRYIFGIHPIFNAFRRMRKKFNKSELKNFQQELLELQKRFYKENNLDVERLRNFKVS